MSPPCGPSLRDVSDWGPGWGSALGCFGLYFCVWLSRFVCLFVCLFDMSVFPGRIMMCEPELGWLYPAVVYVNWCFDNRIKIGCFNKLVIGFVFASHILVLLVWFLSPKWTVIDDDF